MAVAYGQDLRDRVLAAYDRGLKTKQIAELFQVSRSWARRVKQRRREAGETTSRPRGGATVIKIDLARLADLARRHPDATTKELHALLGADCVESAVGMALKRLGLSFKKRRYTPQSKTARMSRAGVLRGNTSSRRSTPNVLFLSMKPGPKRI
jgi:transposase